MTDLHTAAKLAREAGFTNPEKFTTGDENLQTMLSDFWENLERFATLAQDDYKNRLADAIKAMPFGDTAASFAQFVRNFK